MSRVIIVHESLGIFVGARQGVAFWSMHHEAGGLDGAITFHNEQEARCFIRSWDPPHDPDQFVYHPLRCRGEWATLADLAKAGLTEMCAALLANARPAGTC